MKPRTKAFLGAIVVLAISIFMGMFIPSLGAKGGLQSILGNATELTAVTMATCRWWWVVPAVLSVPLLALARGRESDDPVFNGFYWGFVLLMMVIMILVVGGLLLPMMQVSFVKDQL